MTKKLLRRQAGTTADGQTIGEVATLPDGRVKLNFGNAAEMGFSSLCALCRAFGVDISNQDAWGETVRMGHEFRLA